MFTNVKPWPANHRLSARVENRGPWITTMVPPSTTPGSRRGRPQRRAVRVGETDMDAAGVEVGVVATAGAVDQLIGHHHGARAELGGQAAHRARPEDAAHAQRAQRPHVGAVGTVCGENSCWTPWRGRKATSCSPTVPTVIGALGAPYGVSRLTLRASGRRTNRSRCRR